MRRGLLGSALAAAVLRPLRVFAAAPGYPRLMEGPMIGGVTPDSITFWGRASGELDVDVEYSTLRAARKQADFSTDGRHAQIDRDPHERARHSRPAEAMKRSHRAR
jgi:hypothetical protein